MEHPLAPLADRFRFNSDFIDILAAGLEEIDWAQSPGGESNPAIWILGHMVSSRRHILRQLGTDVPAEGYDGLFSMGKERDREVTYPPAELLMDDYKHTGRRLSDILALVSREQADEAVEHQAPDGSTTVEGAINFYFFHEVYHLGQLGLIRRVLGKPRFV